MGMYTELHYNVELRRDVSEDVLSALRVMLSDTDHAVGIDHPLFSTSRMARHALAISPPMLSMWRQRCAAPERWMIEVRKLYVRADDPIDAGEFSRLLDVAATGERPGHPELPMLATIPWRGVESPPAWQAGEGR